MLSAFVSSFFARSPNYGLTNCAFSGNIYRQSTRLWKTNMGVFPSGQWGQTVNLLLSASVVRIHPRPPRTPVSEPGTGVSVLQKILRARRVDSNSIDLPNSPAGKKSPCATATTAASGRNREELLGLRPAGCACRPRHDAAAGSRDPGSLFCAARDVHPRPPNKKNPNLFPIGEGFGFFVFFGFENEGSRGRRKTPIPCHRP